MKVLGVDLAWNHTGVALVDDTVLDTGVINDDPKRGRKRVCEADQIERAGLLYDGLGRALHQWGAEADWIAYEFSPWMLAKQGQHKTSNAAVILMAGSLSVFRAAVAQYDFAPDRVIAIVPNAWQRALLEGIPILRDYTEEAQRRGFAPQKAKAAAWVRQVHNLWPRSDHEADAICIASYWRDRAMREGI